MICKPPSYVIFKKLLCLFAVFLVIGCKTGSDEKPNVLIIFTDDQGYGDVGVYGAKGYKTPHLDKLAASGLQLTDFYVPANVCTPSRAGLLTGRYPIRYHLHSGVVSPFDSHGLDTDEITLAEALKEEGYFTSIIGKWHLGHLKEFMPNNQGFDYYYGVPYSNDMDSHYYAHNDFQSPPLPLYKNEELIDEGMNQDYLTKMFTDEAVNQIKTRDKSKPFFMYLAHCMPHVPLHASEKFRGKSEIGLYGDVIMELDWSVGELIETLKNEGILDNTIVIFTSDNGPHKGSAGPLRGMKAETWEGGHRVPAIISWPSKIPQGAKSEELTSALDIFPTIIELAGGDPLMYSNIDGRDLSMFLQNPFNHKLEEKPFFYFARNGNLEAIRKGDWKLHVAKSRGWKKSDGEFKPALYNLRQDISESNNVIDHYPDLVKSLTGAIEEFK